MRRLLVALVVLYGTSHEALAEPETPDLRISITNLLVGRINPLGLEDQLRIGPQKRLYHSSSPILSDNFLFFGATPRVNPAFIKAGPSLEIQPLSILTLRFGFELMQIFGSFGELQSFASPLDNYSDSTLDKNTNAGRNYVTSGSHFTFEPTLRMKLGPVALVNRFSIEYWAMNVHTGDTVFYESTLDTLVPARGWILSNDLDLVYISKLKFVIGARYSVVHPLYQPGDFRPGEAQVNLNGHQRLGPLFAYTFFDHPFARFNKPTLVLIVNWYVDHRWRTGADVSAGVPYAVLGFGFVSDLLIK